MTFVALFAVSRGPVVVVLIGGGAVDLAFAKDDDNVDAILFAGYPGD
jgi:beta-D-xylosidase 4